MTKTLTRYICVKCGKAYHSDEAQATICNACLTAFLDSKEKKA